MAELMTEQNKEEMSQKIWQQAQEDIEKSVLSAIRAELRSDMSSRTRRLMAQELDKILIPMIEARRDDLIMVAEKTVERIFAKMEEAVISRFQGEMGYHIENVFDQAGKQFTAQLKLAAKGVLDKMENEMRAETARRYHERKRAAEAAKKETP